MTKIKTMSSNETAIKAISYFLLQFFSSKLASPTLIKQQLKPREKTKNLKKKKISRPS